MSVKFVMNFIKSILRPVKRFVFFLLWIIPSFYKVVLNKHSCRRLLVIYDLSSQPFSIGDILFAQEAALVLRENEGVGLVDFALVYDLNHPVADQAHKSITENNYMYHLASVLPVAQVNQHIGSLFVFNSHQHLQRFIVDNIDRYHVWPSAWQFATRQWLDKEVINNLLYNYYRKNKTIPHLSCRPLFIEWARGFYRQHVLPDIPISVQVRNNKIFEKHRNLKIEEWLDFFQYCEGKYPVKFIVVCALSEIDDRLRCHKNVLLAKDFHTGIEQDLALIYTAIFHMGATSGPGSIALFNTKPYLFVNTVIPPHFYRDMIHDGKFLRFFFADPLQRFSIGSETTEQLITEFVRMWDAVDVAAWESWVNAETTQTDGLSSWLR
jgi:hypothetical protein